MATRVEDVFGKYLDVRASSLSFAPLLNDLLTSKGKKDAISKIVHFFSKNGVAVEEKRVVRTSNNIIEGNGRIGFGIA